MLADVSNRPPERGGSEREPPKTFARRRKPPACEGAQAAQEEGAASPGSTTASSPSQSSSSPAAALPPGDQTSSSQACSAPRATGAHGRGRRSSCILRNAALPGHGQHKMGEAPASRSLLLARLSKARQRAYVEYTSRMADHFAEVDQFELLEESPGPDTAERKTHSVLLPGLPSSLVAWCDTHQTPAGPFAQLLRPAASTAAPSNSGAEVLALWTHDGACSSSPLAAAPAEAADEEQSAAAAASLAAPSPGQLLASPAPVPAQHSCSEQPQTATPLQAPIPLDAALLASSPQARLPSPSLDALTPATESLAADTPATASLCEQLERLAVQQPPPQPQQQQQQPVSSCELAALPELAACTPEARRQPSQRQRAQQKQQKQQKQQQQAEQQALADAAMERWLAQQEQAAAAQQLEELSLAQAAAAHLSPLQQMLQACGQPVCVAAIPGMADFLAGIADPRDVVKLGEGSYAEAFKSGQVVLKLVPMEGDNLINGWPQKRAGDLLGEAVIATTLSGLSETHDAAGNAHASWSAAFVRTHRVGVCRGPYPPAFIKAWQAWDKRHTSENDAIEGLPDEQLYAVFAMANCGRDLEAYVLAGWEQARAMLLQVVLGLAVAEDALAFEHRDLHYGNVMLAPAPSSSVAARLRGSTIHARTQGASVTLIDFTASRLQTPAGGVVFCDLEAEEGLFEGPKGKPQFEAYRRMRKLTRGDWAGSHLGTNVLWLRYLAELLLSADKPIPGASAANKRALREFKKRLGGYATCGEALWDPLFAGLWWTVQDD